MTGYFLRARVIRGGQPGTSHDPKLRPYASAYRDLLHAVVEGLMREDEGIRISYTGRLESTRKAT